VTIILIGPPGSGKTKLGKRVARELGMDFIDTDKRIVAEHGAIAVIFAEHGEPHFRRIERATVATALAEDAVVSLGGGAILDEDTQRDLEGRNVALITVSAEVIGPRIADAKRPLLAGGVEAWKALVASREHIYRRLASREWDTSHRPLGPIAKEIAAWAREVNE
jgi:shikimate kinase